MKILRLSPFFVLILGASTAFAQPADQAATIKDGTLPVKPTTPEQEILNSLRDFYSQLLAGEAYSNPARYVAGAKEGYYGQVELAGAWKEEIGNARLNFQKVEIVERNGDTAQTRVTYQWRTSLFKSEPIQEAVTLHRIQTQNFPDFIWQIVPLAPSVKPEMLPVDAPPFLNGAALALLSPHVAINAKLAGDSLSHLKQLGLGPLQFVQDYDQVFALAPEYAEKAFYPYLHNDEIWKVPGTTEKYSFNANLADKNLGQIAASDKTVMFYDGKDEKPIFRYDGKAAVGFVDGHVKLVTPDGAKDLIWKP